jgi:hypothetical protein
MARPAIALLAFRGHMQNMNLCPEAPAALEA